MSLERVYVLLVLDSIGDDVSVVYLQVAPYNIAANYTHRRAGRGWGVLVASPNAEDAPSQSRHTG